MVYFTKQTRIENARINVLFYCLSVVLFGAYALCVWIFRLINVSIPIGDKMWTRINVPTVNARHFTELQDAFNRMKSQHVCQQPNDYDYWYDGGGKWTYLNYSCVDLCGVDVLEYDCISRHDIFRQESQSAGIFVTELEHHPFGSRPAYNNFVAFDLSSMKLQLQYGSQTADLSWFNSEDSPANEVHSSMTDILTVVTDYKGEEQYVWEPRVTLDFDLATVIRLAGDNIQLEVPFDGADSNFYTGGKTSRVIPRISGFNIKASLNCYNVPRTHRDWMEKGPVCYLGFEAFTGPWVGEHYVGFASSNGTQRAGMYHGVRIFLVTGGFYQYASAQALYNVLVDLLVLSKWPKMLTLFVVAFLLGHSSVIYYRAVYTPFDITEECKGVAARLITYTKDFEELGSKKDAKISRTHVAQRLAAAVQSEKSTLDPRELMGLVNFCYQAMIKNSVKAPSWLSKVWLDIRRAFSWRPQLRIIDNEDGVNSSQFYMSCCTNEIISFTDMINLFDYHKRGLLERCLVPPFIDAGFQHAQNSWETEDDALKKIIQGDTPADSVGLPPRDVSVESLIARLDNLENIAKQLPLDDEPASEPATEPGSRRSSKEQSVINDVTTTSTTEPDMALPPDQDSKHGSGRRRTSLRRHSKATSASIPVPDSLLPLIGAVGANDGIPDYSISASTSMGGIYDKNFVRSGNKPNNGWCPGYKELNPDEDEETEPWIQFDLGEPKEVCALKMYQSHSCGSGMTAYRITYSNDDSPWVQYIGFEGEQNLEAQSDAVVVLKTFTAKVVRIHAVKFKKAGIILQIELYTQAEGMGAPNLDAQPDVGIDAAQGDAFNNEDQRNVGEAVGMDAPDHDAQPVAGIDGALGDENSTAGKPKDGERVASSDLEGTGREIKDNARPEQVASTPEDTVRDSPLQVPDTDNFRGVII